MDKLDPSLAAILIIAIFGMTSMTTMYYVTVVKAPRLLASAIALFTKVVDLISNIWKGNP